jgi:hypothetical protein
MMDAEKDALVCTLYSARILEKIYGGKELSRIVLPAHKAAKAGELFLGIDFWAS